MRIQAHPWPYLEVKDPLFLTNPPGGEFPYPTGAAQKKKKKKKKKKKATASPSFITGQHSSFALMMPIVLLILWIACLLHWCISSNQDGFKSVLCLEKG